jgi:hypothetical protein
VRNQCLNASQAIHQLESGRCGLESNAHLHDNVVVWGTPWSVQSADREATPNACGVGVAMLQGHSWAPILSNGSRVNVGTISMAPTPTSRLLAGVGKARCRLMSSRWGGGPVVVRDRESRSHGEGVQRVRGIIVNWGGRW